MSIGYDVWANQAIGGPSAQEVIGDFSAVDPASEGGPGGIPYAAGQAPVVYYAGDEFNVLSAKPMEERVRLQEQMVALGLLSSPVYGELDDRTLGGFRALLSMANRTGDTWENTLNRIATNPLMLDAAQNQSNEPVFQPTPYMAPDYATIAQRVKQMFREQLGREPDQAEMAELSGELQGWSKQAWNAEVEVEEGAFDMRSADTTQPAVQGQQVDPMSRFQELFDSKYKGEMQFVDDKQSAQVQRQAVEGGAATVSQMARGSF